MDRQISEGLMVRQVLSELMHCQTGFGGVNGQTGLEGSVVRQVLEGLMHGQTGFGG